MYPVLKHRGPVRELTPTSLLQQRISRFTEDGIPYLSTKGTSRFFNGGGCLPSAVCWHSHSVLTHNTGHRKSIVKTVEAYEPQTDTWTQKAEMPTARTALAVSQGNAKIYAIGGTGVVQGPGLTAVEIYDPLTDVWEKGTEMPTARVFLGAGSVNNEIYAIGGVAQGLGPNILPTVEALTLKSLNIAAWDKMQTVWGTIKRED